MQIYWSLKSIPELAEIPERERGRLWRAAHLRIFRHWQVWVALGGCAFAAALGSSLGELTGYSIIGFAIGAGIGAFLYAQVAMHFARPHIRELLLETNAQ